MRAALCPFYFIKEDLIINENYTKKPRNEDENVNGNIRAPILFVIGPDGKAIGAMPRLRALNLAETYNLDLVCVDVKANPPVCKILNYGKYRFELQKKSREQKRNQKEKEIQTKEVQLSPSIGQHDIETKLKHAMRFLSSGDKVKITMRFKGRQLAHVDVGEQVINNFIAKLGDLCTVEKPASLDRRTMIAVLQSKVKK